MTVHRPATTISVADALRSKQLFGPFFAGSSWNTWRAVLKAAFAETLSAAELATFTTVAGRAPPAHRVKELAAIVGRGGGKDSTASFIAAYVAMSFNPRAAKLRPGELAYVVCLAVDRDQAGIVYRYIKAFFEDVPVLKAMVRDIGSDSITLKNKVVIQVTTNSYRSIRGRSILAAIFDEAAFWRDDTAANPDTEVHAAISPGLARVAGSMLILISSAHRRAGLLYERWKNFFGKPDEEVLVVRGTTTQFNPGFPQSIIDRAIAADPQRYGAEYNSEWRDDLATYLPRELIEAAVELGVQVRPPLTSVVYRAFVDTSGGRNDAFTMSIAHRELHNGGERVVTDCIYARNAPFNPSEVVEEVAKLLKPYRVSAVTGDNYAAEFVVEAFRKCGISYLKSKLDRSEVYIDFLPLVTSGSLLLLDHPRAIAQLAALERRTFASGKDRIDHPTGGHDDIANSIAGAAVLASQDREQVIPMTVPIVMTNADPTGTGRQPQQNVRTTEAYLNWANSGGHDRYWGPV